MKALKFFIVGLLIRTTFGFNPAIPSTEPRKSATHNKATVHSISKARLKLVKAVIVVGPVEEMTKDFVKKAEIVADYLRKLGVKVFTFYPPKDKWDNIVKASRSAHIFYYAGHGTTCGRNGSVGGLCLSNDVFIYSNQIAKTLKLRKNALVIFNSACYSAGSSADDEKDIGVKEALKRVSDYSYPFLKLGAGAYYANNYDDAIVPFLKSFFSGFNMKNNYLKHLIYDNELETIGNNPYFNNYRTGISSRKPDEEPIHLYWTENGVKKEKTIPSFKSYDIAFSGNPNLTYMDWFR